MRVNYIHLETGRISSVFVSVSVNEGAVKEFDEPKGEPHVGA